MVAAELDVRDGDAVERVRRRRSQAELGHVDVLVNNAGGGFHAAFLDVNDKGQDSLDPRELHERHALRPRRRCRRCPSAAARSSTSRRSRRTAPRPGFAVYRAMKAAVANLTQDPGARARRPADPGQLHRARRDPDAGHRRRAWACTRRCRSPATSTTSPAAAVYLACDLGRFVTGTTVHVDGGNLAAGGWARATPTAATSPARRWRGVTMKFGVALGALNPRVPRRGDARGRAARLRVGVAARAPGASPTKMSRSPHPGEDAPAGPARHADLRRVRVPRVPRRAAPSASGSARTSTTSGCATRSSRRAACRRSTSSRAAASSSASARAGSRRSGSRPSSTSRPAAAGSTRRSRCASGCGPRTTVDAPRRVLRRSTAWCSSRSRVQKPWPPILVGGESEAALRRAARARRRLDRHEHTTSSRARAQIARLRELLDERGPRRRPTSRSASAARSTSRDDVARWEELGVTRLIVSPWRRSQEAIEGMRRFADDGRARTR